MNPNVRLFASLVAIAALGGCYVQTGPMPAASAESYDGEYVEAEEAPVAPPPPPAEAVPPAPSNDHVWVEGHYRWHGRVYVWDRGHYEHRPHHRASWVPAHWEKRGHRRVWVNGHWR